MWRLYAPHPRMPLNLGIRRRLAPLLDNDRRKIELANAILFSLPGAPIIYYGDEIGMGDNIWLFDRNGVRTPMQWTGEPGAGFSEAAPDDFWVPLIDDDIFGYRQVNVAAQTADSPPRIGYGVLRIQAQGGALLDVRNGVFVTGLPQRVDVSRSAIDIGEEAHAVDVHLVERNKALISTCAWDLHLREKRAVRLACAVLPHVGFEISVSRHHQ